MSRKEKKYHYIYKTTDIRNGNFYIGMHSTDDLNDGYIGSGTRLRKLIYKHGKQIFNIEILEFLPDRKSLKKREEEIVNSDLINEEKCMNLKPGGYGGFCNEKHKTDFFNGNKKMSVEKRKEIRYKQKKFWEKNPNLFDDFCSNMSKAKTGNKSWTGLHHSEKTKNKIKEKMKIKQKGKKNSQFGTRWITNGIENKKIKNNNIVPKNWYIGRIINY